MSKEKKKRPAAFVTADIPGIIHERNTGELILDAKTTKLVRAYTESVERCISIGAPDRNFKLSANKDGRIISGIGPIMIMNAETAFPGCSNVEEINEADEALDRAGATRGFSPSGRAMDWALRENKELAQWRVARVMMDTFAASLYGGIQFGGHKPRKKNGRINIDICSSYPFQATRPLPRIRDAAFERGLRPHATLVLASATQSAPALFSRNELGATHYVEDVLGWYVKEELDYHVDAGRVKVQKIIESVTFPHFDKYLAPAVEHFFGQREKYLRGSPSRSALKSALNGLLGKFASPISTWRAPKPLELEALRRSRKATIIQVGKSALVDDQSLAGIYPRHSNIIWTALVYARARVKLWEKIDEINSIGGKVLWAHTDCIIADVPPSFRMVEGNALGDWRNVDNESPQLIED